MQLKIVVMFLLQVCRCEMLVYLSLCELLSETEPVEVWGGQCNLDLVYSSVEVLHFCLQMQYILKTHRHIISWRRSQYDMNHKHIM